MQKLINVLAVLSFLGTAGIIGGGTFVYMRRADIADNVKTRITEAITEALPGMLTDALSPELPEVTGGPLPVPAPTTGGLPKL
jgi:hypothetical protein|tara:strand:- start:1406 stop:1654 length:249 start_codon:yes stop_codon:yes gene_type:complete